MMNAKAFCFIFLIALTFSSCTKQEINGSSKPLNERTTIVERYNFNGVNYVLYFDSEDTTGTPTNTSTEDSLLAAIGSTEYNLVYYDTNPTVTYLEPEQTPPTDSTADLEGFPAPTVCLLAQFFENTNFGGASFCIDDGFEDHSGLYNGGSLVSEFYGQNDLNNRSFGNSGNWNDRISSFKMFGSGASKEWYRNKNYASSTAKATFTLYRHSDYETGSCKKRSWVMSLPYAETNTWEVSNLSKEKWRGLLCSSIDDRTTSIGLIVCKGYICFAP